MARNSKVVQKAALKRRKREKEVREAFSRRRAAAAEKNPQRNILKAAEFPVEECVISRGWLERGLAHILLARRLPTGKLLVGGYYVDTLCLGLKDSAVMRNVDEEEYRSDVKAKLFNDEVEFENCEPGRAKAVVEGAIEFAARFGFKPNRRWGESSALWSGIEPQPEGIVFGRDGKPCFVRRGGENVPGVVARLDRRAGHGNYIVESGVN